ncbi:hypothetical protein [Cytobacillus kochii]|nr:hypothetical protein [Cytobacillus kochii]
MPESVHIVEELRTVDILIKDYLWEVTLKLTVAVEEGYLIN